MIDFNPTRSVLCFEFLQNVAYHFERNIYTVAILSWAGRSVVTRFVRTPHRTHDRCESIFGHSSVELSIDWLTIDCAILNHNILLLRTTTPNRLRLLIGTGTLQLSNQKFGMWKQHKYTIHLMVTTWSTAWKCIVPASDPLCTNLSPPVWFLVYASLSPVAIPSALALVFI